MATTKAELYAKLREPVPGSRPMTKVAGSDSINLLPTLTGQGGQQFKRGGMEYFIASMSEVQDVLTQTIQKAYAKAQGILGNIRAATRSFGDITDNWVELDIQKPGRIDRYLTLTDTKKGTKGAMSIEFGRGEYEVTREDGTTYKVGAMKGTFLLHRAFGVPPNSLKAGD